MYIAVKCMWSSFRLQRLLEPVTTVLLRDSARPAVHQQHQGNESFPKLDLEVSCQFSRTEQRIGACQ